MKAVWLAGAGVAAVGVYQRRQFENIWLRTQRKNAEGKVVGGTGGICYVYFPTEVSAVQRRALAAAGIC